MGSTHTQRAVRIANCSGAEPDPGRHMFNQAKYGQVDVITEVNLANNAEAYHRGEHNGWIPTCWEGIEMSVDIINEKRIKLVINGGCLNPKGLAEKTHELVTSKGLDLVVAYVEGDDVLDRAYDILGTSTEEKLPHLDKTNSNVQLAKDTKAFLDDKERMPIVSANAYLGIRAIRRGLDEGADIVVCGRVADASPVIAAAAWWHGWADEDYGPLAGALIAGHLIECSTYTTGANFAGFHTHDISELLDLGLPIAEVEANGECVITKHEALNGFVDADTVKCQLLYELQGTIYLNSDVKADITNIRVENESKDRVRVSGVKGAPPPSTTKLAVFYKGGYQCEMLLNATGYASRKKFALQEAQLRHKLKEWGLLDKFDILDFQWIGRPEANPSSQLASTTYLRIFAQSRDKIACAKLLPGVYTNVMQHFSGFHSTSDHRTAMPKEFLGFYPAVIAQSELEESINIISKKGDNVHKTIMGPPKKSEPIGERDNFETANPVDLSSFGETVVAPLGDVAFARSGDKGANVNFGVYVHTQEEWDWLRTVMTRAKLQELMGSTWEDWFYIERCEMAEIKAVHFVVYGPLGRGVSSSKILDALGKGFADFIRDRHIEIPKKFLGKWDSHAGVLSRL
ncbi:uncharacterized protein LTR77_006712 [Saxophila tyrrhenica]|uniref:DUF1446-domain-containing protein n=1 Tax=Saxophila tyrrhenica TaxID=1690608 RepID=A0AAV9P6B6_9PEZI|nr:hypothetical protein LTR77_006712 [Saxophila tyrrhenica]